MIDIRKEQKFVKFYSRTLKSCLLAPLAHFLIIFALFRSKNCACFRVSLNVALEWYISVFAKQWCKALKRGHAISEKEGPEATAWLSFPNIHPWACNLSRWQSTCD